MPDFSNIAKKTIMFGMNALGLSQPVRLTDNGDGTGNLVASDPTYKVLSLTDGSVHSITGTTFVGLQNLSLTAQSVSVTLYDNPSGASGPVVALVAALGPTQVITWPSPGRPLSNGGLTAQASGTPGGSGIEVYVR